MCIYLWGRGVGSGDKKEMSPLRREVTAVHIRVLNKIMFAGERETNKLKRLRFIHTKTSAQWKKISVLIIASPRIDSICREPGIF